MTQPLPPNPNLPPGQLPDVGPLAAAHQQALTDLQAEWAGLTDKQKAALVDAVYTAVAAGTVADLLTLPIDITGTSAALTAAMVAIAATAAHLLVAEAADQGVHVPAVHVPAAVFEPTAQVVAGTLGDELRITAARAALQYGPDANPTDVADAARAALDARSGASETKQLGGALHGAMNTGRIASLRRAPTGAVYAQEMNDSRVCVNCREVNGRWLGNIPDDLPQILAMYPDGAYGGYIYCLGGINCRGTITGVWRPDQVEAANRRRLLAKAGQHRDHHKKPDYTPADLGVSELHDTQVDPQDVNVDRQHYQRDLDPDEVDRFRQHPKRLAKRWGLLARRPDGSLWVVNGQHHTQAAVDEGIRQMRYRVFDSTGPAQEGKVYAAYQRWHDGWHAARPEEPRNQVRDAFNPDELRDPHGRWSALGAVVEHVLHTAEGDVHTHTDEHGTHLAYGDSRSGPLRPREAGKLAEHLDRSDDEFEHPRPIRNSVASYPPGDPDASPSGFAQVTRHSRDRYELELLNNEHTHNLTGAEAKHLSDVLARHAAASRVDTTYGPLDVFPADDDRHIVLRPLDNMGEPVALPFDEASWDRFRGAVNVVYEGFDELSAFGHQPEEDLSELRIHTNVGNLLVRRTGVPPGPMEKADKAAIEIAPAEGGSWRIGFPVGYHVDSPVWDAFSNAEIAAGWT